MNEATEIEKETENEVALENEIESKNESTGYLTEKPKKFKRSSRCMDEK